MTPAEKQTRYDSTLNLFDGDITITTCRNSGDGISNVANAEIKAMTEKKSWKHLTCDVTVTKSTDKTFFESAQKVVKINKDEPKLKSITSGSKKRPSDITSVLSDYISQFEGKGLNGLVTIVDSKAAWNEIVGCLEKARKISFAVVWKNLTSNHETSTVKYCTAQENCHRWNCTCDKHVRVEQAYKSLVGFGFIHNENPEMMFLLPLHNESVETGWKEVFHILSNSSEKVCYNGQVGLLPLLNRLDKVAGKTAHNFKSPFGISNLFDVKVAEFLLNSETDEKDLELNRIFSKYGCINELGMMEEKLGKEGEYFLKLGRELRHLLDVADIQRQEIHTARLDMIAYEIDMPLIPLLTLMEIRGINVSTNLIKDLRRSIAEKISQICQEAFDLSGGVEFNLASPEQVANIVYNSLGIKPSSSAKKLQKHWSTSEDDLLAIRHCHPIIEKILIFRALSKLMSTYMDGITPFVVNHKRKRRISPFETMDDPKDLSCGDDTPRIHALWNQTIVRTGRLSCCKPNLQNIPNYQEIDGFSVNIRSLFIPSRSSIFISADYSQIEMRILAHCAEDRTMKELFYHGQDIYQQLASVIFSKASEQISPSERSRAKTICLGVIYGMGAQAASQKLGLDVASVERIMNRFFQGFHGVEKWIRATKSFALKNGFVSTVTGRRRYIPDIQSENRIQKSLGERQAVNSIIQGSASDILKLAMLFVEAELSRWPSFWPKPKLVLQIHDELVFEMEIPNAANLGQLDSVNTSDQFLSLIKLLKYCMENSVSEYLQLSVPLVINVKSGHSWGHLESVNTDSINIVAASSSVPLASEVPKAESTLQIASNKTFESTVLSTPLQTMAPIEIEKNIENKILQTNKTKSKSID